MIASQGSRGDHRQISLQWWTLLDETDLISKKPHLENRTSLPDSGSESDEEAIRKIDELLKDPKKLREAVESRIDRVVKNWPKH
jgi:hypothetical protein